MKLFSFKTKMEQLIDFLFSRFSLKKLAIYFKPNFYSNYQLTLLVVYMYFIRITFQSLSKKKFHND